MSEVTTLPLTSSTDHPGLSGKFVASFTPADRLLRKDELGGGAGGDDHVG